MGKLDASGSNCTLVPVLRPEIAQGEAAIIGLISEHCCPKSRCENDRLRNNTGATFSSWEEDVAKLCCLFLLDGNRISQQRFMPEDLVQVVETELRRLPYPTLPSPLHHQ